MTTRGRWVMAVSAAVALGVALWAIRPAHRSASTMRAPADAQGGTASAAATPPPPAPSPLANDAATPTAKASADAGADAGVEPLPPAEPAAQDAQALFAEGKKTIESNLGDAYGATRAKLEQGIAEIREALRLGHPDRKGGEVLIGLAYEAIAAGHVKTGTPEQRTAMEHAAEAYRAALELDPSNLELRLNYAAMLRDSAERLREYREAVRIAPNSGKARFALAYALINTGNEAEGARELMAAVPLFTDREFRYYGEQTARELQRLGFAREAARIDERLKSLGEESR